MRKDGIRISEKHGVNPALASCVACGKEWGVVLFGRLPGDKEAPRKVVSDFCEECSSVVMAGGVMLVEVRDGETGDSPYRTGRAWGIRGEAFERIFPNFKKATMVFIEEFVARKVGLPEPMKDGGVA